MRILLMLNILLLLISCSSNTYREPVFKLGQNVIIHEGFFTGCFGQIRGYSASKKLYYLDLICPQHLYAYRRGVGFEWVRESRLQLSEDKLVIE